MTDSPCGFSTDQFLATLKTYGPELSAHEVAALSKVSVRQVLCCHHHAPWEIEAVAGEKGWLYRKRPVLSARGKVVKEIGQYNDGGLSHSGQRAVLRKEVASDH